MSSAERYFDIIEAKLAEFYTPYERVVWWSSPHKLLGDRRAIDCLGHPKSALEVKNLVDELHDRTS